MSENNTGDKATDAQVATITKQAHRFYKGTASTAISVLGDFKFFNAIGRDDEEAAVTELRALMAKLRSERVAYKAANPQSSAPSTEVPATIPAQ